ncbi:response regulator [Butyrivibrio sp. WCE2006]|uniref:response regulator n=1 Tax=Butyrivibrio sp. WCE2006 TaxID=1410611 RepID=UPI000679801B|nr:response regulator [Butyrivibrio sp. WCE2006]
MIKKLRYLNNQIMAVLAISLLVLVMLGAFLYMSITSHVDEITKKLLADSAKAASNYYQKELMTEMRTLEHISIILDDKNPDNQTSNIERTKTLINDVFDKEPSVLVGVIDADGKAIIGEDLSISEYQGILYTLCGIANVSYLKTGAILFSYPVLNGDNVHYAVYAMCSASYIRKYHNLGTFNNIGNVSLITKDNDVVISFNNKEEGDEAFYNSNSVREVFKKLRVGQKSESVNVEKVETVKGELLFYTAEIKDTPFVLAGTIDYETAAGEMDTLVWSIMSAYGLFVYLAMILAIFLIISSVKVRESDELRNAKQVAEKASKAKGLFLANMSHEIRTPINAILGMDEMILRNTRDRKLIQYAYSIKSSANSLLSLVSDILDFSRLEAGKLKLRNEPYHFASLLTDVIVMIKDRADSKGLYFNIAVNKEMPDQLVGDNTRIKQVIINLLTNAVKYTNTGGVNLGVDFIKVNENEIDLSVSVKDTGIGLKQEDLDKIFLAFERFDEKKNSTVEGTGLGMSIVKQILDAMGSNIHINSIYGVGSVFSFVIRQKVADWEPIGDYEDTSEKAAELEVYKPGLYAPTARILAVDDMEINLRVVKGLLEQTAIVVDTALSGKEALELIANNKYDVMLIDHRMPEMDGIELLNRIRNNADNPNKDCICIALTANVTEGVRDMYINAGFNDYLEKPVSGTVLEETLHQYIPAEKLEKIEGDEDETSEANKNPGASEGNENAPEDKLGSIRDKGIFDIETGIDYAGTEDMYIDTLRFFRDTIEEKADEIESLYYKENIEDYTIKVHALKSSAKLIGANDLSEHAKRLEEAGKSGDLDYIRNNTYDLLTEFRNIRELLEKI